MWQVLTDFPIERKNFPSRKVQKSLLNKALYFELIFPYRFEVSQRYVTITQITFLSLEIPVLITDVSIYCFIILVVFLCNTVLDHNSARSAPALTTSLQIPPHLPSPTSSYLPNCPSPHLNLQIPSPPFLSGPLSQSSDSPYLVSHFGLSGED